MRAPNDDSLAERLTAARACLDQLCPPAERERRAAVTSDGVRQLAEYQAYLAALEGEHDDGCPGLRGQLADRAFAAEGTFRVLLAEGLKSLNDLRDSGMLHAGLSEFARTLGGGDKDLSRMFRETREELQNGPLTLPREFFDETLTVAEQRLSGLRYESETDTLVVRRLSLVDGTPEEMRVRLSPQAGDMGRIAVDQFFGAADSFSVLGDPIIVAPSDCHQRATAAGQAEAPQLVDAYAGVVGGMAVGREVMYRHARKVSRYGHGNDLRGHDPFDTAVGVAIVALVVAFVAFVVGGTTGGTVSMIAFAIFLVAIAAALIILVLLSVGLIAA